MRSDFPQFGAVSGNTQQETFSKSTQILPIEFPITTQHVHHLISWKCALTRICLSTRTVHCPLSPPVPIIYINALCVSSSNTKVVRSHQGFGSPSIIRAGHLELGGADSSSLSGYRIESLGASRNKWQDWGICSYLTPYRILWVT